MKHKADVRVIRKAARQVSFCLDGIAASRTVRHLDFVLEHYAGDEHMVLQILANANQIHDNIDAKATKRASIPDAGEHQKLGTVYSACGKNHFLVGSDVLYRAICVDLDANTTSAFEVQFHDVGVEQKSQVRSRQGRVQ